jgi:hypothetical protein
MILTAQPSPSWLRREPVRRGNVDGGQRMARYRTA